MPPPQVVQVAPDAPHASVEVPLTQVPVSSQQPAQLLAVHERVVVVAAPLALHVCVDEHTWAAGHATQKLPPVPHRASVDPASHVPSAPHTRRSLSCRTSSRGSHNQQRVQRRVAQGGFASAFRIAHSRNWSILFTF